MYVRKCESVWRGDLSAVGRQSKPLLYYNIKPEVILLPQALNMIGYTFKMAVHWFDKYLIFWTVGS